MPFVYYREARGFFGWVFLIMFFSLNAFMALLLWRVWTIAGEADSWTGLIMFFWGLRRGDHRLPGAAHSRPSHLLSPSPRCVGLLATAAPFVWWEGCQSRHTLVRAGASLPQLPQM
jgi:hypothetical protein